MNRTKKISFQIRIFRKTANSPETEVGKFQNWAEMKVNDPTNKKNTHKDFSDHFHNIENFVQVEHLKESLKNRLFFSYSRSRKTAGSRKNFPSGKN
jgi:hypothetical protein